MRTGIRAWPTSSLLGIAWLGISAALLLVATVRIVRFHKIVRKTPLVSEPLRQMSIDVAGRLGYRSRFDLRLSNGQFSPLLWGIGRPTIVLPQRVVSELEPQQLTAILAHEIAHLLRRDHWVRWVELLVFCCCWWHPVAWWARRELRDAEEHACDARVIAAWEGIEISYVNALIAVIDLASRPARRVPQLAIPFGQQGCLLKRVENIMERRSEATLNPRGWLTVLLFGIVLLPLSLVAGPDKAANANANHAVSLTELREGVKRLEQSIQNLSVKCLSIEKSYRRNPDGNRGREPIHESNLVDQTDNIVSNWIVDSSGKNWRKDTVKRTLVRKDQDPIEGVNNAEAIWDGTVCLLQFQFASDPSIFGFPKSIRLGNNGELHIPYSWNEIVYGMSPLNYTVRHERRHPVYEGGIPISKLLSDERVEIVGKELWEESQVIVVEISDVQSIGKRNYKEQLWIDPGRGFAAVRRRTLMRDAEDQPWQVERELDSIGLHEVSPGIWLPKQVRFQILGATGVEFDKLGLVFSSKVIRCSEWKVNQVIPEDQYQIEQIIKDEKYRDAFRNGLQIEKK